MLTFMVYNIMHSYNTWQTTCNQDPSLEKIFFFSPINRDFLDTFLLVK